MASNNIDPEIATPQNVTNEELKKLLEENQALLKEVHDMTHKIKGYITFQKAMSFVYLVLIVGPIILSIIYLPPLLRDVLGEYRQLLNPTGAGIDLDSILKNSNLNVAPK